MQCICQQYEQQTVSLSSLKEINNKHHSQRSSPSAKCNATTQRQIPLDPETKVKHNWHACWLIDIPSPVTPSGAHKKNKNSEEDPQISITNQHGRMLWGKILYGRMNTIPKLRIHWWSCFCVSFLLF